MTKEELIFKIYELLQHPLVPPEESVCISAVLEKMSEEDLKTLHTDLIERTHALLDTERIFTEIESQAVSNFDPVGAVKDRVSQHPLADLPLAIAAESLRDHVMEYLAKGIDLRQETELYFQILRDIIIYDGEETKSKIETYPEILRVFLEALRNSNVLLTESSEKKSFVVKEVLKEYDSVYPFSSINRGGYERASFVDKLNIEKTYQVIVRKLLDYYDFLINESHFEVIGLDSLKEFEKLRSPIDEDEDTTTESTQYKIEGTENTPTFKEKLESDGKIEPTRPIDSNQTYTIGDLNKNKEILESRNVEIDATIKQKPELKKEESLSITPIVSPPQIIKSTKPALVFHIEDEKEADKFRALEHVSTRVREQPVLEQVLRQFVDEVIAQKNLVFKDEVNKRRFIQLMVSRLKDVRGPLEIAEALRKPIEAGGLGMSDDKADQVQAIVEAAKQEFESRIKNPEPRGVQGPAPDVVPDQESKPAGSPPVPGVASSGQELGTRNEPAPRFDVEAAKAWREQMLRDLAMQGQAAATESPAVPRPQLMDVKAPPRVVGPLEELRSLTLTDFRRLGATPPEALQKIHAKIDLLGETSLARRLEAVRAWKTSAVYQQYLKVGHESIEQGKPVSVIVGGYQTLGEQILTEEEFSSIADFNAKLRF